MNKITESVVDLVKETSHILETTNIDEYLERNDDSSDIMSISIAIEGTDYSEMFKPVIEYAAELSTDSNELNNDNNAESNTPHGRRQSLSNAQAFSALYDTDVLDKFRVSKYVASQKQDMKSTLSDLMGKEWASRAWSSTTPKININAWIRADKILEWNKSILLGKVDDLPSYTDLAGALLFNTDDLKSTIADGIYEDMCVNAIVCYDFAALVAAVARQNKPTIDKLKDQYETECEFYGFMTNSGCNSIFTLCHGALVVLRAIMLTESGLPLDSNCKHGADCVVASFDNSWGKTPNTYYDMTIGNSFRENYVMQLCRVLKSIERRHSFSLGQNDADTFKIPRSILMGDKFPHMHSETSLEQLHQVEEMLSEGCDKLEMIVSECENDGNESDSLALGLQVESGPITEQSFRTLSIGQVVRFAMLNEHNLSKAVVKNDMKEAMMHLATSVVIENTFFPLFWDMDNCSPLNKQTMFDIRYKNQKYTSIVETGSTESVSQYIQEHRQEIVSDILKGV